MPTLDLPCGRAPTMNAVYGTLNRYSRAAKVKVWREAAAFQVRADYWPAMRRVAVDVWPVQRDRRVADVGACMPGAKAVIDGVVDAGVLDDDGPKFVVRLTFHPALILDWDGLRVQFTEEES